MNKLYALIVVFLLLLGACSSSSEVSPTLPPPTARPTEPPSSTEPATATAVPATATEPATATAIPATATPPPEPSATEPPTAEPTTPTDQAESEKIRFTGLPLPTERGELFVGAGVCAICHTNLVDQSGADVSNEKFWRSTMMANASRDPYWRASVRREVLSNPEYGAIIEDKCATCHMPMARTTAAAEGGQGTVFQFYQAEHDLHTLALDGVSCTLCHQVEAAGLGQPSNFSGGYLIDTDLPTGERLNYGPFQVAQEHADLMQMSSGYIPVESQHVRQRDFCATCHMLYTPYIDANGEIAGEFPEQMPYLEWVYSSYRNVTTCQDCHMPPADGGVVLSTTGGPARQPVARHIFVGGNTFLHRIFLQFADEFELTASSEHFHATIDRVLDQLQNRTATVSVENVQQEGGSLSAEVVIDSQVGHKFPTGFPSRRTWLHLRLTDGDGQVIFESGAVQADGLILGNDNDADPAAYEPHYAAISAPDQVQIYEAIMANTEGEVTTTLLKGAGYLKDNRVLPQGFDKSLENADVMVYGAAADDDDFVGGGDRVRYQIDLGGSTGPYTLQVELLYQSIGYRWADNLGDYQAPEIETFLRYYAAVPNTPILVDSAVVPLD